MAHDDNLNDQNLPDPRPPLHHPPMMDLSFAALGWLNRAAQAVGSPRFTEAVTRSRFYLERARGHAFTPAECALITGLASSLQGLIEADVEARRLLEESLSEFDATFEAGCIPTALPDCVDDSESQEHGVSQDPAA